MASATGFGSRLKQKWFLLLPYPDQLWGPPILLCSGGTGVPSRGKTDNLRKSRAQVKNDIPHTHKDASSWRDAQAHGHRNWFALRLIQVRVKIDVSYDVWVTASVL
jgi:hypothetical protein